jgi:AcrR family transcriptional regulator
MSIRLQIRKRLSPQESRALAVAAARELLRDEGVAAVTLKSVAAKIGRTHANLLHHFGSVADLHRALAEDIAATVSASIS